MGLWKGKKGSSVFYKITNSSNKEKQGIREYQPEVSNPQTNAQADQRMKMLPIHNLAGALKEIISRSFEGVPYGPKSRLAFRKYALRDAGQIPYLPMGEYTPIPGEYLISKGSLGNIDCWYTRKDIVSNIRSGFDVLSSDMPISVISNDILVTNPNLRDGDQLTFVACSYEVRTGYGPIVNWWYRSMILDTTDETTTLVDIIPSDSPFQLRTQVDNITGSYCYTIENDNILGGAVIVSRKGDDGNYLRSTSRIAIDRSNVYYSASEQTATRASYQTRSRTRATDWPVENDEESSNYIRGTYRLSGLTAPWTALNGREVATLNYAGTDTPYKVYISPNDPESELLVDPNGEWLQTQSGQDIIYLYKDAVQELRTKGTLLWTPPTLGRTLFDPGAIPDSADTEPDTKKKKVTKPTKEG